MSENEQNLDEGQVVVDDVELEEEQDESIEEQPKEEKPKETLEEKEARLERQLARVKKQRGVDVEKPTTTKKQSDFDYGQLAFHNSLEGSIKVGMEDVDFLKQQITETGKDLSALLSSKWFQAELKERQESRKSENALPKGNKRSASPSQQDEKYWTAKIEAGQATLNDIQDVDVRRKVLNMRVERERTKGRFSETPIVSL